MADFTAQELAMKPITIRRKMFGPNQYVTYCPKCFKKGIRNSVKKYKRYGIGESQSTAVWAMKCARKNKEGMPDCCGWIIDL